MPVLICLRKELWTGLISVGDQVPTCPVFTRAKIKSRLGILVQFAVTQLKISHLFEHSLFYLTYRLDPIKCYHSRSEWIWEQCQWRGTPHSTKSPRLEPCHYLMSYPGHSLGWGILPPLQRCNRIFYSYGVRVVLREMATKMYSPAPRSQKLKPHHQKQFKNHTQNILFFFLRGSAEDSLFKLLLIGSNCYWVSIDREKLLLGEYSKAFKLFSTYGLLQDCTRLNWKTHFWLSQFNLINPK